MDGGVHETDIPVTEAEGWLLFGSDFYTASLYERGLGIGSPCFLADSSQARMAVSISRSASLLVSPQAEHP